MPVTAECISVSRIKRSAIQLEALFHIRDFNNDSVLWICTVLLDFRSGSPLHPPPPPIMIRIGTDPDFFII
jgi:hypothetical protein